MSPPPSRDRATRVPLPETKRARSLPARQPSTPTISCTISARSGVWWRSSRSTHRSGNHETVAPVRGRIERLASPLLKERASAARCPAMISSEVSLLGLVDLEFEPGLLDRGAAGNLDRPEA